MNKDPKLFWNRANSKRKYKSAPSRLQYNNAELTQPQHIEMLLQNTFNRYLVIRCPIHFLIMTPSNNFTRKHHTKRLRKSSEMKCVRPKRAAGADGVPQYIYKACVDVFTTPLAYGSNLAISTSTFPHYWAVSAITPIPKRSNTNNITVLTTGQSRICQ